ncbi:RNA-directed DNA polymerase, eukaryota, reverse transcriptase zinc-binding domain protein [Tanacetum coccineum]|uniref:RNA-directed DNA polymerase, eukaryota, reverse transcriptase zinc-binding domain protein n=1 Tax=Tanacetum coccineum TaxID=301880 RepID=A0ABQ4XT87_9ASTR
MRSKRTIKPTKIFDNSVSNSSKNINKQKNVSKNKEYNSTNVDETVVCEEVIETVDNGKCSDNNMEGEKNLEAEQSAVESSHDEGMVNQGEKGNNNRCDVVGVNECSKGTDDGINDNGKVNAKLNNNPLDKNSNTNEIRSTYASKLSTNSSDDGNKLFFVPTCTNKNGDDVVRFEEELVREGCEKWKHNVCGYFVRCRIPVYELKYNIRRMWGRFGLKDIVVDADEMCFFKFKSEEQMNFVLDQSPWLVNGKPMIVQNRDPEAIIIKEAPCKIHVWIKLFNVPLEAWSIKGISTISSRLGLPVKMDNMTAEMCKEGSGRLGFARVLVEIEESKEYVDKVEIDCVDSNMNSTNKCNPETEKGVNQKEKEGNDSEGFVEVRNGKNRMTNQGRFNHGNQGNNVPARREQAQVNVKYAYQPKNQGSKQNVNNGKNNTSPETSKTGSVTGKAWKINKENVNEIKRSANKYATLSNDENGLVAMERKEAMGEVDSDEEDVYVNQSGAIHDIIANERIVDGNAWVLIGDFNVTVKPEEKSTGVSIMTNEMGEFRDAIQSLEIDDICSSGFFYTWIKSLKNPLNSTLKKLDRIMCNETFLSSYGQAHGWYTNIKGCNMFKVVKKMRNLKKALNDLNWKNGNLFEKVVVLKQQLKDIQSKLVIDPFNHDIRMDDVEIHSKYTAAIEDELKLLHQTAKIKCRVESICGEDGERFKGSKVADQFVCHFQNFLRKATYVKPLSSLGDIAVKKLSVEVANNMIVEVTNEEIKRALFDIDSNKAAGPDGFTSYFFKKAWSIIRKDVCLAVKDFFLNGKIMGELNATLIALVPKIETPVGFHEVMVGWIMTCITSTSFSLCGNGEVCGYFKVGRGLRQGDLISPYIFTLVMKVLNMIMIKEIREFGKFKYHSGCKELKLTHMCFADDLILCNGDKESLGVVKKALHEFSSVFGLLPNLNKSTIFFGSINEGLKRELLQILLFKLGSLPMKYLGVPLIAKKLGVKECKCLLDNMEKRINFWRNKLLSYAVVSDLDKLFKRFLWNSVDSTKGKARVAWNLVCRPKDQGGLGIKPLQKWNEVILSAQIWKIIENKESIWVKWVNTVKLKGKGFWEVDPDVSDSWGWKSMLELRNKMKLSATDKIRNVNKISPWHDKWYNIGPISKIIPKRLMFEARFKGNETVKDDTVNGKWD